MPPKRPLQPKAPVDPTLTSESGTIITINIGELSLGRADIIPRDNRLSKQHCTFTRQNGTVVLQSSARNTLVIQRSGGDIQLQKDETLNLQNGDQLWLLPGEHSYTFKCSPTAKAPVPPLKKQKSELSPEQIKKKLEEEENDRKLALSLQPRECTLCLDEVEVDFMHILSCTHEFCRECLKAYFLSEISSKSFPLKCPSHGCNTEVIDDDLQVILEPKVLEKLSEFTFSKFIENNSESFSCCPTPDCTYTFFYTAGEFDFQCAKCKKRYCLNCKVEYHSGSTCDAFQKWSIENGMGDQLFSSWTVGKKCKQCPKCKKWIEKNHGCNHITCLCSAEFCYVCGGKWPCKTQHDEEDESDSEDSDNESD